MKRVIVDTGPIVGFLLEGDVHHPWAIEYFSNISPPLVTCEAVITEASHLARRHQNGASGVLELVRRGILLVEPVLPEGAARVHNLMEKYKSVPMSFADACLVWLSEQFEDCGVVTLDRHFTIYRRERGRAVPLLGPLE